MEFNPRTGERVAGSLADDARKAVVECVAFLREDYLDTRTRGGERAACDAVMKVYQKGFADGRALADFDTDNQSGDDE